MDAARRWPPRSGRRRAPGRAAACTRRERGRDPGDSPTAFYDELGAVDVLVNNEGSRRSTTTFATIARRVRQVLAVNPEGPVPADALIGSRMVKAGRGSIIMVTDGGAIRPNATDGHLRASKPAMNARTVAYSKGVRSRRRVNGSCGPVLTGVDRCGTKRVPRREDRGDSPNARGSVGT